MTKKTEQQQHSDKLEQERQLQLFAECVFEPTDIIEIRYIVSESTDADSISGIMSNNKVWVQAQEFLEAKKLEENIDDEED
jgi:hypothetical protein